MTVCHCVAIDLGASSGRIVLARYSKADNQLTLKEIHRFPNSPQQAEGHAVWDIDRLEQEILSGLHAICQLGVRIDSLGIDTGVDYVLLDAQGERIGQAISYRDRRTEGIMARAQDTPGSSEIYRRTGIQFLPFNTLYQLRAMLEQQPALMQNVAHLQLIPDYLGYRLTGVLNWEYTNATTTQLLNIHTDDWDKPLLAWAGVPPEWFGKPRYPGTVTGHWYSPQGNAIPFVSVATHDTACAIIAAPLGQDSAWLSSGTWSLMGFESQHPYATDAALAANITNEGGIEGRYRVLKNIMGLWLLQRIIKEQQVSDIDDLIARCRQLPFGQFLINPNDDRFINPDNMSAEIRAACLDANGTEPLTDAQLARTIFDSLALLYARVLSELSELRGRPFTRLHILGGGSQNALLNQLCADACGIPVIAGPAEASVLGNVGCQLMALDIVDNVDNFRQQVRDCTPLKVFHPHPDSEISQYVRLPPPPAQNKEFCA